MPGAGGPSTGAGDAVGAKVRGDSDSNGRRYAGQAASGAVEGALTGGFVGAAAGAGKAVASEAGKDAAGKAQTALKDKRGNQRSLGAGGTSFAANDQGDDKALKITKRAALAGSASMAPPAAMMLMLMAFFAWLKTLFFMMMAVLANLGNLMWQVLWAVIHAVVKAVTSAVMTLVPGAGLIGGIGSAIGGFFGGSSTASFAAIMAVMFGVATVGVLDDPATQDGSPNAQNASNCIVNVGDPTGGGGSVPAGTEKNAKVVYSIFKTMGMPDENIAGILGNWSQESQIDPTSVEGIFDEPYRIGPRKQAAWDADFTQVPGQSHGGIGLGQWSNGRTETLLNYAKAHHEDWYKLQTQLPFMVKGDNPGDAKVVQDMLHNSKGSPAQAAIYFHDHWERSADSSVGIALRAASAAMWMGKLSGWTVDPGAVDGVDTSDGGAVDGGNDAVNAASSGCDEKTTGVDKGVGDPGTPATCGEGDARGKPDGKVVYAGTCWYGGQGADIHANGGDLNGTKWQCTELVRRFWTSKGWAPKGWHAGTGSTIWSQTVPGATSEPQGEIAALSAGDILSMSEPGSSLGHVGIVNYITPSKSGSGYDIEMASQNTPQAIWHFHWDGSSITPTGSGFQSFTVTGVMHHESAGAAKGSAGVAIKAALSQLDHGYVWGGGAGDPPGPSGMQSYKGYPGYGKPGYDCEGLVRYAIWKGYGVILPAGSSNQLTTSLAKTVATKPMGSKKLPLDKMKPGDYIVINGIPGDAAWGHVVLYMGGSRLVEAANPKIGLRTDNLDYISKYQWKVRRVTSERGA